MMPSSLGHGDKTLAQVNGIGGILHDGDTQIVAGRDQKLQGGQRAGAM
jgi:hypothetical protein